MSGESSDLPPDSTLETVFYHTDRVRLLDWQELSTAKMAVVLTGAGAVLTFVTGLSHLSRPAMHFDGPLVAVLPVDPGLLQFTGVLIAFVLTGLVFGLRRRKRLAWYLSLFALPTALLLPLTTFRTTDVPLLVIVALAVPVLVINGDAFDRRVELSSLQIASLSSILGVGVYGTVGSYVLRDQFAELDTWGDSVYYVIVTIATVGYGDITPLSTGAKWFSLSVILFGTGAFTVAIGALIVPAIEKRMAAAVGTMTPSDLTLFEDHVLVLGSGELTAPLLETLLAETDVVVVTSDSEAAAHLETENVDVLTDDPTDEAVLETARIDEAAGVVVATQDDARDVLAILAARNANPAVRIVAAAADRRHLEKLEQVGADEVISPTTIGGRLLGRSVLDGTSAEDILEGDDSSGP